MGGLMNLEEAQRLGLLYVPSLGSYEDTLDQIMERTTAAGMAVPIEFSASDVSVLSEALRTTSPLLAGMEIGSNRNANPNYNSTHAILRTKPPECKFFPVDLVQERVMGLSGFPNVFPICANSSDYNHITSVFRANGVDQLDFMHIDGLHSVNQVLDDWKYTELLSDHGVVAMHDTNVHPGPVALIEALDPTKWILERHFTGRTDDWGISVIRRAK
jgi:hypothetical protein